MGKIDFYRIEVYYNPDQTIDAFLYLRIPEDSTYYGCDDRWDLSGAKLDLLSDGTTLRKLMSSIMVDRMQRLSVRRHLGFVGIGDCPALCNVSFSDFFSSEKIADIYFDDGSPAVRLTLEGRAAYDHDVVRRFMIG